MRELELTYNPCEMKLTIFPVDSQRMRHIVEVVRCKDCVWFSKTGYDEDNAHEDDLNLHMGHCSVFRTGTQACRFCSYGERKDK